MSAALPTRLRFGRMVPSQTSATLSSGFTLTELLVVIAIIATLAALLLPALTRAKSAGQSVSCLSNLGQMQKAYLMYVDDNNDRLPPNRAALVANADTSLPGSWVTGNAQTDTNTDNIKAGVLFRFVGSASVYHCPADKSTVTGTAGLARTRSYSLQNWLNGAYTGSGWNWGPESYPWSQVRLSTVRTPPPSDVFGFIDEPEQSIPHGLFIIEQPRWVISDPGTDTWWSLPADRHSQGCNLSFLDGHGAHWRWEAPKVYKPGYPSAGPGGDLADHQKLQEHVPHDVLR